MTVSLESVFQRQDASVPFDYSFSLDDDLFAGPVAAAGRVFNKTGIVHLEGRATYLLSAECARCGKPILRETAVPVSHVLISHANEEDSDDLIVVDGTELDLDALISEDIYLSMPYRFLCKDDCKGLCPQCGADLNEGACGCKAPGDPRLDALLGLFDESIDE